MLPVAVFAHNEAGNIRACLDSLLRPEGTNRLQIFVLANGCKDDTEAVVAEYARTHHNVRLCSILLGDKANAWNVYVHELAPEASWHFFIDGDVEAGPGALSALALALENDPLANAASALPTSGRGRDRTRAEMDTGRELAGNLYALRGTFLRRIRERRIRMPTGFIGEDSMVGAFAKWDLDPTAKWNNARVVPCHAAGFRYRSLTPLRLLDAKLYWRRRVRYGMRHWQLFMLQRHLYAGGAFETVPQDTQALCQRYLAQCRLRWRGAETVFDWLALRRLWRQLEGP